MAKKIILIISLILCMILIFLFSSQNAAISGELSGGVTLTLAKIFVRGFEDFSIEEQTEIVEGMHFYIRKAAHFTEYMILGILAFLNAHEYLKKIRTKFLVALPFCLLYAASDEFHQLFTDGRCGSPVDVMIDFSGSLTGTLFALLSLTIISKINNF